MSLMRQTRWADTQIQSCSVINKLCTTGACNGLFWASVKQGHEQRPEQSSHPCNRVGSDPVSAVHRAHECYHPSFCRVALFFVPRRIGAIHCFEEQDSEMAVGHLFWLHLRLHTATQDPAASHWELTDRALVCTARWGLREGSKPVHNQVPGLGGQVAGTCQVQDHTLLLSEPPKARARGTESQADELGG